MRPKLLFILFLFSLNTFAQDYKDKTIYLDSLWNEVPENSHKYYRIVTDYYGMNVSSYKVTDYYKSGTKQMEGTFLDRDAIKKNGAFTYYHENGNKSSSMNYDNSFPTGNYECWYENGNKKLEGEYLKAGANIATVFTVMQFWDENNIQKVVNGNGYYTNIDKKGKIYETGKIKNGLKDSTWTGTNDEIKFSYIETYENGKFISGTSTDADALTHKYTELEIRPAPRKGLQHFYSYIGKKLKLPKDDISGKILISFIINKDGSIAETKILKSLRNDIDQEALRTVNSYADWKPGKMRGIDVKVWYTIPISIVTQ